MSGNGTKRGWLISLDGRRYHFDPSKYFAAEGNQPAEVTIASSDERLQEIVAQLAGPSGAPSEV